MPPVGCASLHPWNGTETFFGNKDFADVINFRMLRWRDHPELSQQDPNAVMDVHKEGGKRNVDTHRHIAGGRVKMEAKTVVMGPQAKGCLKPSEARAFSRCMALLTP